MVRFSDFLNQGNPEPKVTPPPVPPAPPEPPARRPVSESPAPKAPAHEQARPPAAAEGVLYDHLLGCVIALCSQLRAGLPADLTEASVLIEQLPRAFEQSRHEIVLEWMTRPMTENFIHGHAVNTSILSSFIGTVLGYPIAVVYQLGIAGLIADLGMIGPYESMVNTPRPLTGAERGSVQGHAAASARLFENNSLISSDAREAVLAHHERLDGSGYPRGLRDAAVSEYARVLAVADVYDAMVHGRPYRRRSSPAQTLKFLIDGSDKQFDRRVVKVLVDEFSLYPPGSAVRLNTNEVGVVVKVRREAPLRPLVLISRDANQNALSTHRTVNLLEHPFIYVKEVVPDQE